MSSTWRPSCFSRACSPATRNADGPISTPRRLWPKSIGTPMILILSGILLCLSRLRFQGEGTLRIDAIEHPWEGNHFADVLRSANPSHGAFQAKAKARVRNAAVPAQVEVPLKCFLWQVVLPKALNQRVVVCEALAAADNFAVAFRSDHVETQRKVRTIFVRGHIKRLHGRWIAVDDDRLVEFLGENRFLVTAEVVAPFRGVAGLLQNLDRVVVTDAGKGRHDLLQLRNVALYRFEFTSAILNHGLYYRAHQPLTELNHVFQVREGGLGLEHPEFSQMTASFGFLGAKCRSECVHLAECRSGRFHIELARLRQIGFLIINVIHFEKRGRSFAGGGSKDRRVCERIALAVHVNSRAEFRLRAYAQNGSLPRGANPKMAAIQKEIHAVLF